MANVSVAMAPRHTQIADPTAARAPADTRPASCRVLMAATACRRGVAEVVSPTKIPPAGAKWS